mmetsp:Transcript_897/g.3044  ORF Transcript_897/g.3044 Transcript_897/m.3044 type:complete len:247 (+) Transcript_897:1122-1862(+)
MPLGREDESKGRVDREARSAAEEAVGLGEVVEAGVDAVLRDVVAEEDDVGLQDAVAAPLARRQEEVVGFFQLDVRVAVGPQYVVADERGEAIHNFQFVVVRGSLGRRVAAEADAPIAAAVQRDDVPVIHLLVEAVDVLRDHQRGDPSALQLGDGRVGRVRSRRREGVVAPQRAIPVALPEVLVVNELVVSRRPVALAIGPVLATVVRDPRCRRHPSAREHDDPLLPAEPAREHLPSHGRPHRRRRR